MFTFWFNCFQSGNPWEHFIKKNLCLMVPNNIVLYLKRPLNISLSYNIMLIKDILDTFKTNNIKPIHYILFIKYI